MLQNHVILSHVWMYHQGNDKTPISFVISKHIINSYSNWTIKIRYILVDTKLALILCTLPVWQTRRRAKKTDSANHYSYKWLVWVRIVCLLIQNQNVDILWTCKITNYISLKYIWIKQMLQTFLSHLLFWLIFVANAWKNNWFITFHFLK